ncbi:MAG: hypothetical protein ABT08_07060 [Microbacterium sp. SCN 71-21]|uniref:DeoR/GlpR family DNA-binding transcription regulator n=1 Tax=Microbacterium sp. SCN 71-21 TaxID=1660116 RepID=UPI00086AA514|nr:DeoR/GlpR family DNA-binding transcription regulator [Microbacterium sp. SCN 71-21]ODU77286.1 MAG: hypothetical protein ABT08_07060 [Microbacterium sp. SCN 71-21]
MDVAERRSAIVSRVASTGDVELAGLAAELGVSAMTLRRDIEALRSAGAIPRRASAPRPEGRTADVPGVHLDRAAPLAEAVVAVLEPGSTVMIAGGAIGHGVARTLIGRGLGLTIVTPSPDVALVLAADPDTTVVIAGGLLRGGAGIAVGADAERVVRRYNYDTAVIDAEGLDAVRGVTAADADVAEILRAGIDIARRVVVGASAASLGVVNQLNVTAPDNLALVVTDAGAQHPEVDALAASGIEVVALG